MRRREAGYLTIAHFADSLLNCQLWIHYIATVLLELRHLRPEYKIRYAPSSTLPTQAHLAYAGCRIVRSPDGESRSYSLGQLSIQRAGVAVLQNYYQDFPVFNPFLLKLPGTQLHPSAALPH